MRITDKNVLSELTNYLRGPEGSAQGPQDVHVKDASKSAADKVEISQRSKDIQKARDAVEAVPDVRENKVNDIKKSIEDKTYNVKGEAVANSIIKKSLIDTVL